MAIQLEIAELKRISSRCNDLNDTVASNLKLVNEELNQVCVNVQSSSLVPATQKLVQAINVLSNKLANNLPAINNFLAVQTANYEASNIVAEESINQLISSISNTFGGNSN